MAENEEKKNLAETAKKKGLGFIGEFKAFILRGNVMDMAIGVIIGGAFANIVTALTNDFINPLINSVGGAEFGGSFQLPWTSAEGTALLWGDFLTAVVNFLIMAFILFLMLKSVNKLINLTKKKEEEAKEEAPAPIKTDETILLEEIRDILKERA